MEIKILDVKDDIIVENDKHAKIFREELKAKKTTFLNLMSSPGSGKTTTLTQVINRLKGKIEVAVLEADIDGDCDAYTISEKTGAKVIQLHTGGMCHLDAGMTRRGLEELNSDADLVVLENIGNLVCPCEFDTGANINVCILSVPEGDDKPLKYPLMFSVCDLIVINKIDTLPVFNFDIEKVRKAVYELNPNTVIIPVSAKTGEGIDDLCAYIEKRVNEWRNY